MDDTAAKRFQKTFLCVYGLVFGADWLQVFQSALIYFLVVKINVDRCSIHSGHLTPRAGTFHLHFVQRPEAASRGDSSCTVHHWVLGWGNLGSLRRLTGRQIWPPYRLLSLLRDHCPVPVLCLIRQCAGALCRKGARWLKLDSNVHHLRGLDGDRVP